MSYTVKVVRRFSTKVFADVVLHTIDAIAPTGHHIKPRLALKKADGSIISVGNIENADYEICADYRQHQEELKNGIPDSATP